MKNSQILKYLILFTANFIGAISAEETFVTSLSKDLIPPSPSSAVYRTYMGSQPSLATGAVNITIPIYDISYQNFKIPIFLSYQTNGIKVTDDPYPCGYGWNLMPGLRISRTIMGRPDELFKMIEKESSELSFEKLKRCIQDDNLLNLRNELRDTQADLFSVSLPGNSFSFVLNRNLNSSGITDDNSILTSDNRMTVEIETTANDANYNVKIKEIRITDPQGILYHFGDYTECLEGNNHYITSWMIKMIEFPNGQKISFEWGAYHHIDYGCNEFTSYSLRDNATYRNIASGKVYPDSINSLNSGGYEHYGIHTTLQHLNRITFPSGVINFQYAEKDRPWLQKIEIINRDNLLIKTANFKYHTEIPLLSSIELSNEGTYSFDYWDKTNFRNQWTARDYWGFYNGHSDNRSLIPIIDFKVYENNQSFYFKTFGEANREVNQDMMKANLLKQVNYPTGGYSTYEYEPHQFIGKQVLTDNIRNNKPLNVGGGLRVRKIITAADADSEPITVTYQYGKDGNGLAVSLSEPTLDTFIQSYTGFDSDYDPELSRQTEIIHRQVWFHTTSNYLRYEVGNTPIWYEEVTEFKNGGKTVYKFENPTNRNEIIRQEFGKATTVTLNTLFSEGPILKSESIYEGTDGSARLLKETIIQNTRTRIGFLSGLSVCRNIYSQLPGCPEYPDFTLPGNGIFACAGMSYTHFPFRERDVYSYNDMQILLFTVQQTSTEVHTYTNSNNMVEKTSFTYAKHNLPKKKETTASNGDIITEEYFYPFEPEFATVDQKEILATMTAQNMIASPYRTVHTEKGNMTIKTVDYGDFGRMFLPKQILVTQGNSSLGNKIVYDYDTYGNIRSVVFNDDIKETFLWGYQGLYPVLYAKGIDYNEYLISNTGVVGFSDETTEQLRQKASQIRTKLKGLAQTSSYTYIPLVGMESSTDPSGQTTYYHYDEKFRLKEIVDSKGNTRKQFAYKLQSEHMTATIDTDDEIILGDSLIAKAVVSGGSGWYKYKWELLPTNTTLASEPELHAIIDRTGVYSLKLIVTDAVTEESCSLSKSISIVPECISIMLEEDHYEKPEVTGTITCRHPLKAIFSLLGDIDENGIGEIWIGPYMYFFKNRMETLEVHLPAGTTNLRLSLGDNTRGTIRLILSDIIGDFGETCCPYSPQMEVIRM